MDRRWPDWGAELGADGHTISLLFSRFEVTLDEARLHVTRNCAISFHIESARPAAYAVTTLFARTYAFLETDAEGRFRASARLESAPGAVALDLPVSGPVDRSYEPRVQPAADALAWSRCGLTHALEVETELSARSDSAKALGYLTLVDVDIENSPRVILGLDWRACP